MTTPLDPRTLRWCARKLKAVGEAMKKHHLWDYACGVSDAGGILALEAKAIEKRRTKKAGKRS